MNDMAYQNQTNEEYSFPKLTTEYFKGLKKTINPLEYQTLINSIKMFYERNKTAIARCSVNDNIKALKDIIVFTKHKLIIGQDFNIIIFGTKMVTRLTWQTLRNLILQNDNSIRAIIPRVFIKGHNTIITQTEKGVKYSTELYSEEEFGNEKDYSFDDIIGVLVEIYFKDGNVLSDFVDRRQLQAMKDKSTRQDTNSLNNPYVSFPKSMAIAKAMYRALNNLGLQALKEDPELYEAARKPEFESNNVEETENKEIMSNPTIQNSTVIPEKRQENSIKFNISYDDL